MIVKFYFGAINSFTKICVFINVQAIIQSINFDEFGPKDQMTMIKAIYRMDLNEFGPQRSKDNGDKSNNCETLL